MTDFSREKNALLSAAREHTLSKFEDAIRGLLHNGCTEEQLRQLLETTFKKIRIRAAADEAADEARKAKLKELGYDELDK